MEYTATAKYIHMSPRKVRLIAHQVRKQSLEAAIRILTKLPKKASGPLLVCMQSAIANAKQKNVAIASLHLKTIEIMGGPVMKRWHAVSRGMAHEYKKRMTHIKVVLIDNTKIK